MTKISWLIVLITLLAIGKPMYAQINSSESTESAAPILRQDNVDTNLITYALDGQLYLMEIGEEPQNISAMLDEISTGADMWLNISPDGQWLLLETERFDPECNGWACVVLTTTDLAEPTVIYVNDAPLHVEGFGAVASGGDLIVYTQGDGPHIVDIYAISRVDDEWSNPVLLTDDSPYAWNNMPALSPDGNRLLFDCGDEPYGAIGTSICEVNTDGSDLRVVLTPDDAPPGSSPGGALHHADYTPDGSIVFEGDWGGEQIWRLPVNASEPVLISVNFNNDNSPCVLPDDRIVSLWLDRPDGEGFHELKIMNADGLEEQMLIQDADIADIGLGCGGEVQTESS